MFCSLHLCRYRSFSRDRVLEGSGYSHRRCANNDLWILIGTAVVRIVVGGFLNRTAVKIVSCCLLFAEPLCFVISYWLLLFIQFIRDCEVLSRTELVLQLTYKLFGPRHYVTLQLSQVNLAVPLTSGTN